MNKRILLLLAISVYGQVQDVQPAWTYDTHDSLDAARGGGRRPALEVTPVYDSGRLYVSTPWGSVAALEAKTGKEI